MEAHVIVWTGAMETAAIKAQQRMGGPHIPAFDVLPRPLKRPGNTRKRGQSIRQQLRDRYADGQWFAADDAAEVLGFTSGQVYSALMTLKNEGRVEKKFPGYRREQRFRIVPGVA